MVSENIVPPFKVVEEYDDGLLTRFIIDRHGNEVVRINYYLPCATQMASELCTIMNENHKRLCHAANGEEVRDAE